MSVYGADVYTTQSLSPLVHCIKNAPVSAIFIAGITEGKASKHAGQEALSFLAENMLTTIRLLSEEGI